MKKNNKKLGTTCVVSSAVGEVASVHRPRRAVPRRRRLAAIFETTKKDPKNHASRRVRPPNPMDEPPFLFFAVARFGRTVGFFSFSADGGVATPPPQASGGPLDFARVGGDVVFVWRRRYRVGPSNSITVNVIDERRRRRRRRGC